MSIRSNDVGAALLKMLEEEGWDEDDLRMFMHPESTVLRTMARTNVKSRVATGKTRT